MRISDWSSDGCSSDLRALQYVGDDLHVPMPVLVEAGAGQDAVLVDDAKRPETRMVGVAIAPEGEAVPAVEPSRRRLAALGGASYRHHLDISFPQIRSCRCSRVARSGNSDRKRVV